MLRLIQLILILFLISCTNHNSESDNRTSESNDLHLISDIVKKNSDFEIISDNTNFIENQSSVGYVGEIYFKNLKKNDILQEKVNQAEMEIDYKDQIKVFYPLLIISGQKKWLKDQSKEFSIMFDFLSEGFKPLRKDDFYRTPDGINLFISLRTINVDNESDLNYIVDLLPKWKHFQELKGLR